jgi:transcription initiation factor TFIIH subunit 2
MKTHENDEAMKYDQPTQEEQGYVWEKAYQKTWEKVREDPQGFIEANISNMIQDMKRKRLMVESATTFRRRMIRQLFLILDFSRTIDESDLRPSRLDVTLAYVEPFIMEYFDQNPISQFGVVIARHGSAVKSTELSGHPAEHIAAIKREANDTGGEFSLQNALEVARQSLVQMYGKRSYREILLILSSLTTCDPGNLLDVLELLKKDQIRVSIISLAAEVYVYSKLCRETRGVYRVILNETHYREVLWEHVIPPAILATTATEASTQLMMGFPMRSDESFATFCACHAGKYSLGGYQCPRCCSKICDLPMDCPVCGLMLVSSTHLARSYHHLFPVALFREVMLTTIDHEGKAPSFCFGCHLKFEGKVAGFECTQCFQMFCIECDVFIHEMLHNCPGCDGRKETLR